MKITLAKKETEDPKKEQTNDDVQNELPADDENTDEVDADTGGDEAAAPSGRERQLELEKAKLEGQLEIYRGNGSGKTSSEQQRQAQLNTVYQDLKLDDDEFKDKYQGWSKVQVLQGLNHQNQVETSAKFTKMEVKNSLARKYPDFIEYEDEIDKALADANPEVLQDPARLKRFMEREYVASQKEAERRGTIPKPKTSAKTKEEPVKKIVRDFQAPTPRDEKNTDHENGNDEVKEEDRSLAAKFGIKTETQRKKYMSAFIPMDLGGGIKFEDPKRGFEKVQRAS